MPQPPDREFEIKDSTVQDANVAQGDDTRTLQGRNIKANVGDGNVFIEGKGNTVILPKASTQKRPRLEQELLTEIGQEVKYRLRQSLHNQIFIELGKQQLPNQVKRPWDAEVKIGNREPEPITDGQTITDVFYQDTIAGKLLILGHPGVGKTTTLLELAKDLIAQAKQDVDLPIPVLFNLSSWQDNKQSIAQWLVKELKEKYGVRETEGQKLLTRRRFLPCLDGLDELAPERQELCVQALNNWLGSDQRLSQVVICSRFQEYDTYETVLNLNGAIWLQPLKLPQIESYLMQTEKPELWYVLSQDSTLLELVAIPLWLSVLTLAYEELELKQWRQLETSEKRLAMLLDAYVSSRLHSEVQSSYYKPGKSPKAKQTLRWLVWLAQNMEQDEFLIERMQPSLLITRSEKWQMRLLASIALGIVAGLVSELIEGLLVGISLSLGIGWGLIRSLRTIDTVEILKINLSFDSLRVLLIRLATATVWGLFLGLIGGLIVSLAAGSLISVALLWGIILGLIAGPIWGLTWGLIEICKVDIQTRIKPNQGILNSGKNTLTLILLAVPVAGFLFLWLPSLLDFSWTLLDEAQVITLTGIGVAILFLKTGIYGGGEAYLRHYALRFVLARSGKIPYLYTTFLNYCTERLLLQRVGGRFRFLHRTLKEHFAAMPLEDYRQGMKP